MKKSNLDGSTWGDRVYEMKNYEGSTEEYDRKKIDLFNAGGEIKLFDQLGFNAFQMDKLHQLIYWPEMAN